MTRSEVEWVGTDRERSVGRSAARAMFVLSLVYVVVFIAGFGSIGNVSDPLPDPYFAVGEILILVMAPIMVLLMWAIHECAPPRVKAFTHVALGWMFAAAAFTTTVHFVELTVARHINAATFPGYARIFDFEWPSLLYAVDIVAWDVFFGLSLLFAVPAFARTSDAMIRRGFILSGSLCLIGLVGPAVNQIAWRGLGILGYAIIFPLTCLPLSRAFQRSGNMP